ncbi:MAG TPA: hypothetical protein VIA06_21695 [Candidatus Dormibacteraeota bacterium]|jgi:hypothetical protein|nr:hypothetical protein [Candidatus Dormibacteraeota bacterium]
MLRELERRRLAASNGWRFTAKGPAPTDRVRGWPSLGEVHAIVDGEVEATPFWAFDVKEDGRLPMTVRRTTVYVLPLPNPVPYVSAIFANLLPVNADEQVAFRELVGSITLGGTWRGEPTPQAEAPAPAHGAYAADDGFARELLTDEVLRACRELPGARRPYFVDPLRPDGLGSWYVDGAQLVAVRERALGSASGRRLVDEATALAGLLHTFPRAVLARSGRP